jgi:hypothetical protein
MTVADTNRILSLCCSRGVDGLHLAALNGGGVIILGGISSFLLSELYLITYSRSTDQFGP